MLELIVLIAVIVIIVKIVNMGGGNGAMWGAFTLIICLLTAGIVPCIGGIPIIRVVVGGIVTYALYASITMARGSR